MKHCLPRREELLTWTCVCVFVACGVCVLKCVCVMEVKESLCVTLCVRERGTQYYVCVCVCEYVSPSDMCVSKQV